MNTQTKTLITTQIKMANNCRNQKSKISFSKPINLPLTSSKTKSIKALAINSFEEASALKENTQYLKSCNSKKYFQAPFETLKEYCKEESMLIQLSTATILQAMIDCTAFGNGKHTRKIREDARNWIFSKCKNFQNNCQDAGLSPEFVLKITRNLIS